ncbi:MAG: hypothetical protein E7Z77_04010 [Methanobrevibacter sp.]|uniref:DUF6932 family protein n=1 Tax=Methanobrevibacter sp. TaxID=66852 RepID=UPI0025FD8FA2|nr:hypothetical protein [Methanobrevibacter sp.]MBE6508561.1 hypothetical protein [Methanobrevibacter sp.]
MKMRKFDGFDKKGNLPYGLYNMTLDEIEEIFSKNKSSKRQEIMKEYKKHLEELQKTGYYLDHWIDGSFTTTKENPNDIDTLTEFDGLKVDENNDRAKMDNLIFNSKDDTNGLCHSLRVYRYPYTDEKNYKIYLSSKLRILFELFGSDLDEIPKGIVHLVER